MPTLGNAYQILIVRQNSGLIPTAVEIQKARVQQPARLDPAHGGEQRIFDSGVVALELGQDIAQTAPNRAGFLRATARNDRRSELRGESSRQIFGHVDE